MSTTSLQERCKNISVSRFIEKCVDYSFLLLESPSSIYLIPRILPQPMNCGKFTQRSFQPRQMLYDFPLILSLLPKQKRGKVYIFKLWIPRRYIDMNPHSRQIVFNKGIFQIWIHHYIDMYPHYVKTYKSSIS